MLKPAILYKEEIERALAEYFYTDDMMYYQGCLDSDLLKVSDKSGGEYQSFQYAVVDTKGKLIGYIAHWVDYYSSTAYGFGAFSFDKGNPIMGRDMYYLLERLIAKFHRVEFRAIQGNPAIRGYSKFLNRHKDTGRCIVLTDVFKDRQGNYRNSYIYEFVKGR